MYLESGVLLAEVNYKKDKEEGITKVYDANGGFFLAVTYKNGKAVSGICANGKKLNNAELSNFENGLNVNCSY